MSSKQTNKNPGFCDRGSSHDLSAEPSRGLQHPIWELSGVLAKLTGLDRHLSSEDTQVSSVSVSKTVKSPRKSNGTKSLSRSLNSHSRNRFVRGARISYLPVMPIPVSMTGDTLEQSTRIVALSAETSKYQGGRTSQSLTTEHMLYRQSLQD